MRRIQPGRAKSAVSHIASKMANIMAQACAVVVKGSAPFRPGSSDVNLLGNGETSPT